MHLFIQFVKCFAALNILLLLVLAIKVFSLVMFCLWQAGGFSLEVNNTNPGHVMVGVRVLVGSQSIDRAPSYIDVFGRTLPVQYAVC